MKIIDLSRHVQRVAIGGLAGVGALVIDHTASHVDKSILQMILWTLILFVYSAMELRDTLKRKVQQYIAIALGGLHFLFLYFIKDMFPFRNTMFVIAGLIIEGVVLVFLYARIGQSLDPDGPFGLTEKERLGRATHRNL